MRGVLPAALRRVVLAIGLIALIVIALQISVGGFRIGAFGLRVSNRSLALPIALALASASLIALLSRTRAPRVVLVPVIGALAAGYMAYARSHDVFVLRDFERRFITAGTYVARELPENAVVITIQQSGSVRHYGRRPAALWDALAPDGLDEAVAELERAGRRPIFLARGLGRKSVPRAFYHRATGCVGLAAIS